VTWAPTYRTWIWCPGDPVRDRAQPGARRGRDSSILNRLGRLPGHCGRPPSTAGATATLAGRRIGVAGLGKVGKHLTTHLLDDGASVLATDVSPRALDWVRETYPQVDVVSEISDLITSEIDVYAPCALGGALDDRPCRALRAKVVAGAAITSSPTRASTSCWPTGAPLRTRLRGERRRCDPGADEIEGFNFDRAKLRATRIYQNHQADPGAGRGRRGPPGVAADRLAERRMGRRRAVAYHSPVGTGPGRRTRCPGTGPRAAERAGPPGTPRRTGELVRTECRRAEVPNLALDMYRMSHERCLTSSGPAWIGLPRNSVRGGRAMGRRPCQGQADKGGPGVEVPLPVHRPRCTAARAHWQ